MTPPPDHPLLTRVLAEAADYDDIGLGGLHPKQLAASLVDGIPPITADRLEAALDVCRVCGFGEWAFGGPDGFRVPSHPMGDGHTYVPLVEVPHDHP